MIPFRTVKFTLPYLGAVLNVLIVRSRVAKKRSGTLRTAFLPVDGRPSSVRDVGCNRAFGQRPVPFQGGTLSPMSIMKIVAYPAWLLRFAAVDKTRH